MKTNIFFYIILVLLCFVSSKKIFCQTETDNPNKNNEPTFWEIKEKIDNYLDTYKILPKGWKQYKRAEAFWQNRLLPDGKMTSAKFLLNELNSFLASEKQNNNNYFAANKPWTAVGPFVPPSKYGNGKINCITIDPQNDSIIWIGAVSGGIWRSTDKGNSWNVIPFTDMLSNGIMDIAIAPSDPNIMYATSGDAYWTNLFKSYSLGVLKSTNRGKTWEMMTQPLDFADSLSFYKILVHPQNPDIVYASTNRSILKTVDGGKKWETILSGYYFRDMKFKPNNPDIIYASSMCNWSVGGASIYMSENAGKNWEIIKTYNDARRIELAVTPAKPDLLYALTGYYFTYGGMEGLYVYKTNENIWNTILNRNNQTPNYQDFVFAQSFHNLAIGVSPTDENFIFIGGVYLGYTTDGGKTWIKKESSHCDNHIILFHDSTIYCANDGGINKTSYNEMYNKDNNSKWIDISNTLNITQYYRLGAHPYTDKLLLAGCQDNGTHLLSDGNWYHYSGGDGMECQFNPKYPQKIKTTSQRGGGLNVEDNFAWVTTFIINPLTPDTTLICGKNVWVQSYKDTNVINTCISNFIETDFPNELRTIAISQKDKNYIYTASVYRLYYTKDYGTNWEEIYNSKATVTSITVSPDNPELFWTTHAGHFIGEKVSEFRNGERKNISYNLPNVSINCAAYHIKEKILFIGTDIGVFKLENGSEKWELFNDNMPYLCVNELEYVPTTGYLYAATWGRGVWKVRLENCDAIAPTINRAGQITICRQDLPIIIYKTSKQDGYKYFWCNGVETDTLTINETGKYYLIGVSPEGCSEVSEIFDVKVIDIPPDQYKITLLNHNPACIGDTVKYKLWQIKYTDETYTPYTYVWSNGCNDTIVNITEPTDLSITVTNSIGCSQTFFVDTVKFLAPPPIPKITKYSNLLVCHDSAYTYKWLFNGELINNDGKNFVAINYPGNYQVGIKREDIPCFSFSDVFEIKMPDTETDRILKANITPNPNTGEFNLEVFYEGDKEILEINLYDSNGGRINNKKIKINKYSDEKFDLSNYASGKYFFELKIKDYKRIISFIIDR